MTTICRFGDNRLGIVEDETVLDVTAALDILPTARWPFPLGDMLVQHLGDVIKAALAMRKSAKRLPLNTLVMRCPVANPSKIMAAPVNYLKHQAEALADGGVNFDKDVKTIEHYGLFLKSNTSLVGFGDELAIAFPNRRTDHEIELVAVVGKPGHNISRDRALDHVAGYMLGLDMTLRGPEDRSLRKSLDGYTVAGPWLITADEIANPNILSLGLKVNGQERQRANTRDLIFNVETLIEYASKFYALYPGDLIFTGTPEGVGPVIAGDTVDCWIETVGQARLLVTSLSERRVSSRPDAINDPRHA